MLDSMKPDDEYRELVDRLRRLKPLDAGLCPEDAFYSAGWTAATAKASRAGTRSGRFGARSFATGLVLGVLAAAGGLLSWQNLAPARPQLAMPIEAPEDDSPKIAKATSTLSLMDPTESAPTTITGVRVRPWTQSRVLSSGVRLEDLWQMDIDWFASPLVGVRSNAHEVPRTNLQASADIADADKVRPLRTLPFSEQMIDELM